MCSLFELLRDDGHTEGLELGPISTARRTGLLDSSPSVDRVST